jgi:hypothetical protein
MSAQELPRSITRQEYRALRQLKRVFEGPREDQGLPHHPDGTGLALCPVCYGDGVLEERHWNPQLDKSHKCMECGGTGYVPDGPVDILLRLHNARKLWSRGTHPNRYNILRRAFAKAGPKVLP